MKKIILLLLCYLCFSCQHDNGKADIAKFINSSIIIPNNISTYCIDTTLVPIVDTSASLKFIVYLNSLQCDDCKLRALADWNKLLKDTLFTNNTDKVNVIFIFQPKRISNLRSALILYHFHRPVFFDRTGEFEKSNLLPEEPLLHTFLLDQEGKVRLVGSPIGNAKMWNLYKQTIKTLLAATPPTAAAPPTAPPTPHRRQAIR